MRAKAEVPANLDEAGALEIARGADGVRRALDGREVVKEIVRAPKLVNFVTRH